MNMHARYELSPSQQKSHDSAPPQWQERKLNFVEPERIKHGGLQRWGTSRQIAVFFVMITVAVLLAVSSSSSFGQECGDSSECGTNINPAICDPLTHQCMAVECIAEFNCATQPAVCENNMCRQVECTISKRDCGSTQVCRGNKCGIACQINSDCTRQLGFGVCGTEGICVEEPAARVFDPIPVSFARPVFGTGLVTDLAQAIAFERKLITLPIAFEAGDIAKISSSANGAGALVIDNFLSINNTSGMDCKGSNACEGVGGRDNSCFGDFLIPNPEDGVGLDIATVLTPIPPIDVSKFIGAGSQSVLFELCDFGAIAGNTDLWLIITPHQ